MTVRFAVAVSLRLGVGCDGSLQGESAHHVVGDGEPEQRDTGFLLAAHRQLAQTHAAPVSVEALYLRALAVHVLADLARHAFAPIRHAGTVVLARRIRIGAVLAL